jgi:uncharacterized membrane protein
MAPLIFLLGTFTVLFFINRFLLNGRLTLSFIGRAAMAVMLTVTGIAHFVITDQMVAMLPDAVPMKRELIYFTGVCELAAVIGLVWTRFSKLTSIMLIIFFIAILPANIADALKGESGGFGHGPAYLLIRIPEQTLYIWWVWYFGLRRNRSTAERLAPE